MNKQVLKLSLAGVLSIALLGQHIIAQAQAPASQTSKKKCSELPKPQQIALPFNPASDSKTFRPRSLVQSDKPCGDSQAIIGSDQRIPVTTRRFPWSAIGRLEWDNGDGTGGICTGTLIGKDLVLTNSHCLIDDKTKQPRKVDITFKPSLIDGGSLATAKVISYDNYGWKSGAQDIADDWALLRIDKPLGDSYGYLGWRVMNFADQKVLNLFKSQIRLAGYSGDYPTEETGGRTAGVHLGCNIEGLSENLVNGLPKGVIVHTCDTMGGASGSAMLALFNDGNYYIVGLHRGSVGLDSSSIPVNLRETCKQYDDTGKVITIPACRNLGVQVSHWAAQATAMRKTQQK